MLIKQVYRHVSKQNAGQVTIFRLQIVLLKGGTVPIFEKNLDVSKFYSG